MAEDRDTEARWYVVHTYSGYENKVAQNLETIVENRRLQELIHEVKVPVELDVYKRQAINRRKEKEADGTEPSASFLARKA